MARYSTPATRAYARDKAEIIGAAERVIYGEILDFVLRVGRHKATPFLAVLGGFAYIIFGHGLVNSINL
jgi:hypothetical protein